MKFHDAIVAECPDVLFVLPKNDRYRGTITTRHGDQAHLFVEGVTIDYAQGMRWEVQHGRFFSENDIHTAAQVCALGAEAATELFGKKSALGHEIKLSYVGDNRPSDVGLSVLWQLKAEASIVTTDRWMTSSVCP